MLIMSPEYLDFVLNLFFYGLLGAIIVDIITGVAKGIVEKDLNSAKNSRGYVKKGVILLIPIVAFGIDWLVNEAFVLMNYDTFLIGSFNIVGIPALTVFLLCWFILGEMLSIIENIGRCGVPLPRFIKERLSQIHENLDDGKKPKL